MKSLTTIALMQEYAKLSGKFCMYISFDGYYDFGCPGDLDELFKAAPYLDNEVDPQIVCDEHGVLTFDTQDEMEKYWKD